MISVFLARMPSYVGCLWARISHEMVVVGRTWGRIDRLQSVLKNVWVTLIQTLTAYLDEHRSHTSCKPRAPLWPRSDVGDQLQERHHPLQTSLRLPNQPLTAVAQQVGPVHVLPSVHKVSPPYCIKSFSCTACYDGCEGVTRPPFRACHACQQFVLLSHSMI